MDDYNLTLRERRVIMDEVRGKTGNDRSLRPPLEQPKVDHKKTFTKSSYLELLRCGGKPKTGAALNKYISKELFSHIIQLEIMISVCRKKKEKPKQKYRSYTEARKDREKFRKRLVEVKY